MASIWAWAVLNKHWRVQLVIKGCFWLERYAREQCAQLVAVAREGLRLLHGR